MSNVTIIDSLYSYLNSCPLLSDRQFHGVDTTEGSGLTELTYVISADQADEQLLLYHGGTIRVRSQYLLTSANNWEPDVAQKLSDTGLFDQLAQWMSQESAKRHLPQLPKNLTPRSIRAVSAAYLYQPDNNSGKYQIQFELEYYRKVVD